MGIRRGQVFDLRSVYPNTMMRVIVVGHTKEVVAGTEKPTKNWLVQVQSTKPIDPEKPFTSGLEGLHRKLQPSKFEQ